MKINKKRNLSILLICGISIYIGFFIYHGILQAIKDPPSFDVVIPKEYENLFIKDSLLRFAVKGTMTLKMRNNISYLSFNKHYNLEVTKINCALRFNMIKDILINNKKPKGSFSTTLVP